jgi:hypothetical protein
MNESIIINLSKNMPLGRRISETSKRITEWLQSLGVVLNVEKDKLQLRKWEIDNEEYRYHYSIISRKELSVSAVSSRKELAALNSSEIPASQCEI